MTAQEVVTPSGYSSSDDRPQSGQRIRLRILNIIPRADGAGINETTYPGQIMAEIVKMKAAMNGLKAMNVNLKNLDSSLHTLALDGNLRNLMAELDITEVVRRTYPAWLNIVAWFVLPLVPISLVLLLLGIKVLGLVALGAGFLGIWVFGELAAHLGRDIKDVRTDGRRRRSIS